MTITSIREEELERGIEGEGLRGREGRQIEGRKGGGRRGEYYNYID